MALESMAALMANAVKNGYGVGYFEAWDIYSMEAVLEAAHEERSPVILGFGGMMVDKDWLDNGGVELLGGIGSAFAARSSVPVSLLLNEVSTLDQAIRGMEAGFNAVMLDTSAWDWDRAVAVVKDLTFRAHAQGVTVEAELGRLPDATSDGIDASGAHLTDPEQAADFVAVTGVDCLAVSIGNVHLLTANIASIDIALLEAIHRRTSVPLVIHGGTSFPPQAVSQAIALGVAKFNVGTILKKRFLEAVRRELGSRGAAASEHDLLGSHKEFDFLNAGKMAMKEKVKELMRLYGSSGRADQEGGSL